MRAEEDKSARNDGGMPAQGRVVQFTGTFLKMVRYAGADTTRLAPLIVGDRQPVTDSGRAGSRAIRMVLPFARTDGDAAMKLIYWALGLARGGLGGSRSRSMAFAWADCELTTTHEVRRSEPGPSAGIHRAAEGAVKSFVSPLFFVGFHFLESADFRVE